MSLVVHKILPRDAAWPGRCSPSRVGRARPGHAPANRFDAVDSQVARSKSRCRPAACCADADVLIADDGSLVRSWPRPSRCRVLRAAAADRARPAARGLPAPGATRWRWRSTPTACTSRPTGARRHAARDAAGGDRRSRPFEPEADALPRRHPRRPHGMATCTARTATTARTTIMGPGTITGTITITPRPRSPTRLTTRAAADCRGHARTGPDSGPRQVPGTPVQAVGADRPGRRPPVGPARRAGRRRASAASGRRAPCPRRSSASRCRAGSACARRRRRRPAGGPVAIAELSSGTGRSWSVASVITSDTESTTMPTTRVPMLSTMTTVNAS